MRELTAAEIPYEKFQEAWDSLFGQMELQATSAGELEGVARTSTGVQTRRLNESRMLLRVMGDALGIPIRELFVRNGIVRCIP